MHYIMLLFCKSKDWCVNSLMICSDMIFFVILSLCAGYMDNQSRFFSQTAVSIGLLF